MVGNVPERSRFKTELGQFNTCTERDIVDQNRQLGIIRRLLRANQRQQRPNALRRDVARQKIGAKRLKLIQQIMAMLNRATLALILRLDRLERKDRIQPINR